MNLGTGIIMDIITAFILLLSTIYGARKGFAVTILSFVQWFGCIILGFIFGSQAKALIMEKTQIDDMINRQILEHIETTIEESSPYQAMPELFGRVINSAEDDFAYGTANSITSVVMTILGFLAVVFAVKILCFLIVHLLSKRYHDGAVGFFDGFAGFVFGIGRGILLILLFYTLLVPVLSVILPGLAEPLRGLIDDSYTAKILYDNNVLLVLVRDFFS